VHYEQRDLNGGGYELVIDNLTPGRVINITYFYFGPITYVDINTHVESDEGQAKFISVLPQRTFPAWVVWFRAVLILVGLATVSTVTSLMTVGRHQAIPNPAFRRGYGSLSPGKNDRRTRRLS